jgi:hypothetical protein
MNSEQRLWLHCLLEVFQRCPHPFAVDFNGAQSIAVDVLILTSDGSVVGPANDALHGSPQQKLEMPYKDNKLLLVVKVRQPCDLWEIVSFRLTVLGVKSFVVRIADKSSKKVEVNFGSLSISQRQMFSLISYVSVSICVKVYFS